MNRPAGFSATSNAARAAIAIAEVVARRSAAPAVKREEEEPQAGRAKHPFVPIETKCVLITVASQ